MPPVVCLGQEQHVYFFPVLQNSWSQVSTMGAPSAVSGAEFAAVIQDVISIFRQETWVKRSLFEIQGKVW